MRAFTVYLFVRGAADEDLPAIAARRLQALQALRDELLVHGVHVTTVPAEADLAVEITNVFAIDEDPPLARVRRRVRGKSRPRVLIVRLSNGNDRMDFVCSDGIGRVPAEQHAAQRIMMWLDHPADPNRSGFPRSATAELTTGS
jgi:hypothetical protein